MPSTQICGWHYPHHIINKTRQHRNVNFLSNLLSWANDNKMEINTSKPRRWYSVLWLVQTYHSLPHLLVPLTGLLPLSCLVCTSIRHSHSSTTMIIRKASSRLYFLKQLKRAGLATHHLVHFYIAVIRPVLEYCAPVWHYALTKGQTQELESIQKRGYYGFPPHLGVLE